MSSLPTALILGETVLRVGAGGDVSSEGANVELKASTGFKAEGGASAEVSSGGTMKVSGTLVQIN